MIDIKKLASDSMIYIKDEEIPYYKDDLEAIISRTLGFKNLQVENIKYDKKDELSILREDKVKDSLSHDEVFNNTEYNKYSYFTINKLDEEN